MENEMSQRSQLIDVDHWQLKLLSGSLLALYFLRVTFETVRIRSRLVVRNTRHPKAK